MAILLAVGGDNPVNLSNAQAGNAVSTNIAQRRVDRVDTAALLRIIAATGSACTYLIEGSPDNAAFFPLPAQDLPVAGGPPGALTSVAFVLAAPATLWKLIPVDFPWQYLRITYSANTAMVNTTDLWVY